MHNRNKLLNTQLYLNRDNIHIKIISNNTNNTGNRNYDHKIKGTELTSQYT